MTSQVVWMNSTLSPYVNSSSEKLINCTVGGSRDNPCRVFLFVTHVMLMGTLSLGGTVGNILTIVTLSRDSKRNLTSFLLLVLAVFDNGVLILTLPVKCLPGVCSYVGHSGLCWYRYHVWPYVMKYLFPFIPVLHFASVWTIVLVTAHRTLAVLAPHKTKDYATIGSVRIQVGVLLTVALLFNLPRFFELIVKTHPMYPCGPASPVLDIAPFYHNRIYQIGYKNIATKIFLDFGPLILLSLCTFWLVREIHAAMRMRRTITRNHTEGSHRTSVQLTVLLVLVVLVFMCCQIPHTVYSVMRLLLPPSSQRCGTIFYYFMNISDTLMIFNSAVNFLLYCVAGRRFRNQLLKLFGCADSRMKYSRTTNGGYSLTAQTLYTNQSRVVEKRAMTNSFH